MPDTENKDTRYFIEFDLDTLEIIRVGHDIRQNLNKGRQTDVGTHRLFLTKGQYYKLVERCSEELKTVLDT